METMTGPQVAEMAEMPYESFRKMNASRKPKRQADKTYLRSDVIEWLNHRNRKTVMLAPVPRFPVAAVPAPVPAPIPTINRGRIIDNEDEHVLHERLRGRAVNVKVLDKVLADMTAEIADSEKEISTFRFMLKRMETALDKKKAALRTYQETQEALVQEAAGVSEDLDDALMETVLSVEAELNAN